LAIGVGIVLLIGFLTTAQELLSESIFGVPQDPREEMERGCMDARSDSDPVLDSDRVIAGVKVDRTVEREDPK
jgi:hypothetical protein